MSKRFIGRYLKNLAILGGGVVAFFGVLLLAYLHAALVLKIAVFAIPLAIFLLTTAFITLAELDDEDEDGHGPGFPR